VVLHVLSFPVVCKHRKKTAIVVPKSPTEDLSVLTANIVAGEGSKIIRQNAVFSRDRSNPAHHVGMKKQNDGSFL
jgi:hypothetical protein